MDVYALSLIMKGKYFLSSFIRFVNTKYKKGIAEKYFVDKNKVSDSFELHLKEWFQKGKKAAIVPLCGLLTNKEFDLEKIKKIKSNAKAAQLRLWNIPEKVTKETHQQFIELYPELEKEKHFNSPKKTTR